MYVYCMYVWVFLLISPPINPYSSRFIFSLNGSSKGPYLADIFLTLHPTYVFSIILNCTKLESNIKEHESILSDKHFYNEILVRKMNKQYIILISLRP